MHLPVLIEPLPDRPGCVARIGDPFHLRVEAVNAEEALRELRAAMQRRLQSGASLWDLTVPAGSSSVAAGWLPDDELTQEWLQAIRDYRRECDEADQRRLPGDESQGGA
jgi:hypothetical protein